MAKVYHIKNNFEENIPKIYKELSKDFTKGKTAIKLHFGEQGCTTYLNPNLVKILSNNITNPSLIECNVLYKGARTLKDTHLKLAKQHGFTFAPIVIADGNSGDNFIEIEINKKHFKKIKIGKEIQNFKNLIIFSHFTGHIAAGFGGALKNLGMGLASRAGKLSMHCKTKITINPEKCTACNICIENCPANAISYKNKKAFIDEKKCIGCAKCIAVCPQKAPTIPWSSVRGKDIQERIVEYCFGINKICDIIYFTSLQNITLECDCIESSQKPIIKNIGILASSDPVAIDKASIDLVKKELRKDPFNNYNNIDSSFQLDYAEKLNLGSKNYKLISL